MRLGTNKTGATVAASIMTILTMAVLPIDSIGQSTGKTCTGSFKVCPDRRTCYSLESECVNLDGVAVPFDHQQQYAFDVGTCTAQPKTTCDDTGGPGGVGNLYCFVPCFNANASEDCPPTQDCTLAYFGPYCDPLDH